MVHHRKAELLPDLAHLRDRVASWRESKQIVAVVPTMGALHAGHQSLVHLAAQRADRILVTIFVNPAQFAPSEDFSKYPRTLEIDRQLLGVSIDGLYNPPVEDIYPEGFCTTIAMQGPARVGLEDRFRPNHFSGVATVVAKLFLQTAPHIAIFGEKDFQQLCVVRKMVRDLDLPVEIIAAPTIREDDGLALSSRNVYLSEAERQSAPSLYACLKRCAERLRLGASAQSVLASAHSELQAAGFIVDYLEWRRADDLQPASDLSVPTRLLVAATLGRTRLIDNIAV